MKSPTKFPLFLPALLALSPMLAIAQDKAAGDAAMSQHTMVKADATQWGDAPPMLPRGAQAAVLAGDPGKDGVFTIRLKMPAGYRIGRHWHPTDEAVTLVDGDLALSMGEAASAHSETLAPGDFVNLPAHMQHEASTKGGAVVQVQSTGPFQITYVDPKDDPRGAMGDNEGKKSSAKARK
jgi:quercetin dioxygenase-like cupin family protein